MSRVWVIPAQINPWKTEKPEPLDQRFWIAHNMLLDQKDAQVLCVVCDPNPDDGKYYAVDQLKKILRGYGAKNFEFWIIGGSDVIPEIESWKDGNWILGNFKTLEIPRPGFTTDETYTTPISSSEIRKLIREGEWNKVKGYLNTETIRYIQENHLYGKES
jgi:nicotinic acid mononucleotide adenylyltransferase